MVLLAGSLISLLAFAFIVLVLPAVGFRLTGLRSRNSGSHFHFKFEGFRNFGVPHLGVLGVT